MLTHQHVNISSMRRSLFEHLRNQGWRLRALRTTPITGSCLINKSLKASSSRDCTVRCWTAARVFSSAETTSSKYPAIAFLPTLLGGTYPSAASLCFSESPIGLSITAFEEKTRAFSKDTCATAMLSTWWGRVGILHACNIGTSFSAVSNGSLEITSRVELRSPTLSRFSGWMCTIFSSSFRVSAMRASSRAPGLLSCHSCSHFKNIQMKVLSSPISANCSLMFSGPGSSTFLGDGRREGDADFGVSLCFCAMKWVSFAALHDDMLSPGAVWIALKGAVENQHRQGANDSRCGARLKAGSEGRRTYGFASQTRALRRTTPHGAASGSRSRRASRPSGR